MDPETPNEGDLLVCIKYEMSFRRSREGKELPGGTEMTVHAPPKTHGMFLRVIREDKTRPGSYLLYIPSQAAFVLGVPMNWRRLKRSKLR